MQISGFIEIAKGIWYEETTGFPWSTRGNLPYSKPLHRIYSTNYAGYFVVTLNKKTQKWHRVVYRFFIGKIPKNKVIDHRNNSRIDCRFENLQLVTHRQNAYKRKKVSTKELPTGVEKSWNKYRARIWINGKNKQLGMFNTLEKAKQAYLKAKIKYHGKDSILPLIS